MYEKIRLILKYLVIFISMVILGLLLLILVALIPEKYIEKNVKESAEVLYEEGENVYTPTLLKQLWLNDNCIYGHNASDAIMINQIYSIDRKDIFNSILLVRRNYIPKVTTDVIGDKLGNLLYNENYSGFLNPTAELKDTVEHKNIKAYEYARYWHGYIVILNILLVFFNLSQIKILISTILISTFLLLTYLIYKEKPICAIMFFSLLYR